MVVKNKKKVFSGGRLGVYALLVALGGRVQLLGWIKIKNQKRQERKMPCLMCHSILPLKI